MSHIEYPPTPALRYSSITCARSISAISPEQTQIEIQFTPNNVILKFNTSSVRIYLEITSNGQNFKRNVITLALNPISSPSAVNKCL